MVWRKGSYNGTAAWPISLKTLRCNAVCYRCNARNACVQDARCEMRMVLAAALAAALGATSAQADPSGPITVMVGFAPGGPTDTLARIITERMRVSLGQPLIIENAGRHRNHRHRPCCTRCAGRPHVEHVQLDNSCRCSCDLSDCI